MAYQKNTKNSKNTKNTDTPTRWTDISGSARIFGEEKEGRKGSFMAYSTSIGRKNEDGEWDNFYARVRFPKEDDPGIEGGFKVNIESGFLTFDTWTDKRKNTHKELALVITDWQLITD